eukprot:8407774-Pyramimonas_sp.AAC.1
MENFPRIVLRFCLNRASSFGNHGPDSGVGVGGEKAGESDDQVKLKTDWMHHPTMSKYVLCLKRCVGRGLPLH